jgi:UDP-N-acetylmuramoyl-tripeptide--D-alanyl-D-alanine ligase
MELHERADGLVVVNDAYNANPASMAPRSTRWSRSAARGARTVAVLGEMLELGDRAARRTARSGRRRRGRVDVVVAVGEPARGIAAGAAHPAGRDGGPTAGRDEALAWVRENVARRGRRPGQGVARGAAGDVADGLLTTEEGRPMRAILLGGGSPC